jgi:poly(3-hydroxybutyrate) depolymerase
LLIGSAGLPCPSSNLQSCSFLAQVAPIANRTICNKRILARKIIVEGLGHAWSGGDERHPFNDAAGPDASRLIWDFVSMFHRD